jgi:hypothetical protein
MMQKRHQAEHRGKGVTDFTGYASSSRFLGRNCSRAACLMKPDELRRRMKPDELRRRRDSDEGCSVKLPICHSVQVEMKTRRWAGLGWSDADCKLSMLYLGCMFAFELVSRIGEYTKKEINGSDYWYRADDLTYAVETASRSSNVAGSALTDLPFVASQAGRGYGQIAECQVFGVSPKANLIGRWSVAESEFLDVMIEFTVRAGARGDEELFGFRKQDGHRVVLTARAVRNEMKDIATRNGLPPNYFSAHSLRKGSITHMRAHGATEDDRKDRGNYAAGLQVMNTTYDYATGLGAAGIEQPGRRTSSV